MPIQKTTIAFSQTNHLSKLVSDYISGEEKLNPYYSVSPELGSFKKLIETKSHQVINRTLLVETLQQQYKQSGLTFPETQADLLLKENTFTVTTGHQLCVFTGPLYFIYKLVSAINLAVDLKKSYPENNFIPVYWMASEDHDFAEINHIHLFGKTLSWNSSNQQAGKGPVGKLSCQDLQPLLAEINQLLGESENALKLKSIFERAYQPNFNLAQATRVLVNELFVGTNLIVIDGDEPALKKEFSSYMWNDIRQGENFKLVNQSIAQLETLGYKAQVNPREINCFYMTEAIRERIVFENGKYHINNTDLSFSETELEQELLQFPERFSPNVVLRPLYQERILPNLAYIGGGGELAYWLEFKSLFEANDLPFPMVILRNSVLWCDAGSNDKWIKFGFKEADFFSAVDDLVKKFISINSTDDLSLLSSQESLKKLFESISAKAQKIDPTLKASVEAELQKTMGGLQNLENKMLKAEKQKQEISLNQIKKIKEKLFPEGNLQERFDNLSSIYLKHGSSFIQELLTQLKPLAFNFTLLIENK